LGENLQGEGGGPPRGFNGAGGNPILGAQIFLKQGKLLLLRKRCGFSQEREAILWGKESEERYIRATSGRNERGRPLCGPHVSVKNKGPPVCCGVFREREE